ncbi:copper chaperone PCu(A)C [Palleronia sp.]|uniref:copper chaperone PCu(A)C n=1 Tax=Palleronia sp. TaxID=1940284 RepID=UPI0035C7BC33
MKLPIVALLATALPLAAHADVTVSDPWARASILASRPAAAYLTLVSDGDDRLLEASMPVAAEVMVHATAVDDAGLSRMNHVTTVELPAAEAVTFAPGAMHLMLTGLSGKLVEGTSFPLTLRFETAGEVTVDVPVLGVGASGPEGGQR